MKNVLLPANLQMNAISRFASDIVGADGNPLAEDFVLDFSRLNFIDGSGYTVLSNAIEWLLSRGASVSFRNFSTLKRPAIQYLDDCGFFARYVKYSLRAHARVRPTTLPCVFIKHQSGFSWVEHRLSPWLEATLDASHGQIGGVRTCVKEVLNNIADHSNVNTGFVHAQHYPNAHIVKITMSDFGDGIPNTIRSTYGAMEDIDAIVLATQDGVTAKSRPNNMGAGLSYLVDTILANQGVVRFHSLTGNLTCLCDNQGRRRLERRKGTGLYPGTLIELELDTRLFVGDDDEREDFEW